MRFRVGPYTYRVRVTDGPIVFDGRACRGLAVHVDREILIAPDVDPSQREEVLRHEVRHAWAFHFPQPSNVEEDCQLYAAIGIAFQDDYEQGGGRNALLLMKPFATPTAPDEETFMPAETEADRETIRRVPAGVPRELRPLPSGERAYCCVCGSVVNGGSVVVSDTRWDERARGRVRDMSFFCPACDRLQTVTVGCGFNNQPDGQAVVHGPVVEQGRAADDFLVKHPDGTGVVIG